MATSTVYPIPVSSPAQIAGGWAQIEVEETRRRTLAAELRAAGVAEPVVLRALDLDASEQQYRRLMTVIAHA